MPTVEEIEGSVATKKVILTPQFIVDAVTLRDSGAATSTYELTLRASQFGSVGKKQVHALLSSIGANFLCVEGDLTPGCIVTLQKYRFDESVTPRLVVESLSLITPNASRPKTDTWGFDEDTPMAPTAASASKQATNNLATIPDPLPVNNKRVTGETNIIHTPQGKAKRKKQENGEAEDHDEDEEPQIADASEMTLTWLHDLDAVSSDWKCYVRITYCSEIESGEYKTKQGKWKKISVRVQDQKKNEIDITVWDAVIPAYQALVQVGRLVLLCDLSVEKLKRKGESDIHHHRLNLNTKRTDQIREANEDDLSDSNENDFLKPIPLHSLTPLKELGAISEKSFVNVLAAVQRVGPLQTLPTRKGGTFNKRIVSIVDSSHRSIALEFLFKDAHHFDECRFGIEPAEKGVKPKDIPYGEAQIILLYNVMVEKYGDNITLKFVTDWREPIKSSLFVGPDLLGPLPIATEFRAWLDDPQNDPSMVVSMGSNRASVPVDIYNEPRLTVQQVINLPLPVQEFYFTVRGRIVEFVRNSDIGVNIYYASCPVEEGTRFGGCMCALDQTNSEYDVCKAHGKQNKGLAKYRYKMKCVIEDASSKQEFELFNTLGDQVFGMNATEVHAMIQRGEQDKVEAVLEAATVPMRVFLMSASTSTYSKQPIKEIRIKSLHLPNEEKEAVLLESRIAELQKIPVAPEAVVVDEAHLEMMKDFVS